MTEIVATDAVEFFYRNAGSSYNPNTETEDEGKRRGATRLAEAEAWAKANGVTFEWSDDWEIDHVKEFDCYADGGPTTCEMVAAYLDGECISSLGCVDDATDEYRRVVEAEVALEARSVLAKEAELPKQASRKPLNLTPAQLRRMADIMESNDDQPGFDMWSALAAMEAMGEGALQRVFRLQLPEEN